MNSGLKKRGLNTVTALLSSLVVWFMAFDCALAGGGPLGIDHALTYDDSGIWKRSDQLALIDALVIGEFACGLWEGGQSTPGATCWQAIDASVLTAVTTTALKLTFTRPRPSQGNNPDVWFQGKSYQSFPSGEVAAVSAVVTPFILEYQEQYPAVWTLEVLPLYDAIARMKAQAHWQTDVLAGFAIGTAFGYYSHRRDSPLVLSVMPHSVYVGWSSSW